MEKVLPTILQNLSTLAEAHMMEHSAFARDNHVNK